MSFPVFTNHQMKQVHKSNMKKRGTREGVGNLPRSYLRLCYLQASARKAVDLLADLIF